MDSGQDKQASASATIPVISSFSAVTLATHDMARAVEFYRTLGFMLRHGGPECEFSTFGVGSCYLNLIAAPAKAPVVVVGPHHLLRVGRGCAVRAGARAAPAPASAAARRRMGRTLFPHHRPRRP